jgi:hypothetical protein
MKLTLEFADGHFHIKNEGRIIASILDEQEAMRVFAHLPSIYLETGIHSCPQCEDGAEIKTIKQEHYNNLQDVIADFRKLYAEEPRTR